MKVLENKPSIKLLYIDIMANLLLCILVSIGVLLLQDVCQTLLHMNIFISAVKKIITLILVIVVVFNITKTAIKVFTTKYILTDTAFVYTKGLFNIKTENLNLYRIVDITILKPLVYRPLGLTDVVLHTVDKTNPILVIKAVENSDDLVDKIKEYMAKNKPNVTEAIRIHQEEPKD